MHKLTDSVNNKTDVWSCKNEILKSTNDLTKTCRIRKQRIRQHCNFEGRNRSINRFVRDHTSPSKDVEKVENHSDECTTPTKPASNHIMTSTIGIHEKEG